MKTQTYTISGGTKKERDEITARINQGEISLGYFADGTGVPRVMGNCVIHPGPETDDLELDNTFANLNQYDAEGYDGQGWSQNDRMAKAANYMAIANKTDLASASEQVLVLAARGESMEAIIERMARKLIAQGKTTLP